MSKKQILFSNDDGRVNLSNTSSIYYETDNEHLFIDTISASNINLNTQNSLLTLVAGRLKKIPAYLYPNTYLMSNGQEWIANSIVASLSAPVYGDLSGVYPYPKLTNISNVRTGSLSVANGGLSSQLISISANSIPLANSSNTLRALDTSKITDFSKIWVLTSVSNGVFGLSEQPKILEKTTLIFYKTPGTYTWTKPNQYHRFARILIMAAGGGGGGSTATVNGECGSGGGGGGFGDITISIKDISSLTVVVGTGGTAVSDATRAGSGMDTYISGSDGFFYRAYGGKGGIYGNVSTNGGAGGLGPKFNGGNGGQANRGSSAAGVNSFGAGGGGAGYWGSAASSAGKIGGISGYLNGGGGAVYSYTTDVLFIPGGHGGIADSSGYSGSFGSGGGGAARILTPGAVSGGNGGNGFVIITTF